MRILIADKLAPEGPEWLREQAGVEVAVAPGLPEDELIEALRLNDGVVVRSAVQLGEPLLDRVMAGDGARLRGIARAGVGVDNIDLAAATRYGIAVMNSASASTITTAEHAFALMIGLARNLGPAHATMSAGGWDRSKFVGTQLHGKVLGVVGFGRIGRTLAERALAFGMQVLAFDPFINAGTALDGRVQLLGTFDELIEQVDVVSFHVPRTETTAGMLGRDQFARARPGLLVVNAARGGIVDEAALVEALEGGHCGGAAIDVFDEEPPPEDHPLRGQPRVLVTPHLGASTVEAQEAVALDACRALLRYLRGESVEGTVNAGGVDLSMDVRHRSFADLADRMTGLLEAASDVAALSAVRVTVRGEHLAGKADAIARHAVASMLRRNLEQPVTVINAAILAERRGISLETVIAAETGDDRLTIEITAGDRDACRVEGTVYADGLPRVTHLDGFAMDMVARGPMVVLTNADEPGRIGLVGQLFGAASVNIAEMAIGRREGDRSEQGVAMMVIRLDAPPPAELIEAMRAADGIRRVGVVVLPGV